MIDDPRAHGIGPGHRKAIYQVADDQMAAGSTLGGFTSCLVIKPTGAIESFSSVEAGEAQFGSLVLNHWDVRTGVMLSPQPGRFLIHPEHQAHLYDLPGDIAVREWIFVLNSGPHRGDVDPAAAYYGVELRNRGTEPASIATYAFCQVRGTTGHDLRVRYDARRHAFIAFNAGDRRAVRALRCSRRPDGYETTSDHAKAVAESRPQQLSGDTKTAGGDPLAVFELCHDLAPRGRAMFWFLLTFYRGDVRRVGTHLRRCPAAPQALAATRAYYRRVMNRSVITTPDDQVNRGVMWAKANMLRVELKAPTGWCFTNDPARSNNSVARDTAWFAYGSDYLTPGFSRASLLEYVKRQQRGGKVPEFYDIRTGASFDYGLNVNDNTPLLVLGLWHQYSTSGDLRFLRKVYPAARKAAAFLLDQRDEDGLVWCDARGTGTEGIVGWRNVIGDYRLSGATTELNAECYAALVTVSRMARLLGKHGESDRFAVEASALRDAINERLSNPENGLYYLNITVDGVPRSDVTADLVFPVMFGVAPDEKAARIIGRLSSADFWTAAGIRTVPRDAPSYSPGPRPAYGLLGGVWVAVSFWYAFAAAPFVPDFMAHALSSSFRHYSVDPRRNNTVPGQFSEWLHGETLVNEGMMLSPWFPPRYLWAAIEGAAGLDTSVDDVRVTPRLAPSWKWLGAQNVPYRGRRLTWIAVRAPQIRLFTTFHSAVESFEQEIYDEDISDLVRATSDDVIVIALRRLDRMLFFAGSTRQRAMAAALRYRAKLAGSYRLRYFDSLLGRWQDGGRVSAEQIMTGLGMRLERKGFWLVELQQET